MNGTTAPPATGDGPSLRASTPTPGGSPLALEKEIAYARPTLATDLKMLSGLYADWLRLMIGRWRGIRDGGTGW